MEVSTPKSIRLLCKQSIVVSRRGSIGPATRHRAIAPRHSPRRCRCHRRCLSSPASLLIARAAAAVGVAPLPLRHCLSSPVSSVAHYSTAARCHPPQPAAPPPSVSASPRAAVHCWSHAPPSWWKSPILRAAATPRRCRKETVSTRRHHQEKGSDQAAAAVAMGRRASLLRGSEQRRGGVLPPGRMGQGRPARGQDDTN
ncbi:hypothetical protein Syun_011839 [Stephania yunnanensis]|uniref:Uncharacterized protein n=1 Tax=Stephania yunnanensis TaxID=152371 RepID=A0AAP0JZ16_9MAGN